MPAITITDFNNAKLDADHIAAVATSTAATATDRLGNIKPTLHQAIDNVRQFIDGEIAIIGAAVWATEAAGRAAVVDGAAFKVQGSGDVAAYEYRRTNSAASVLIATYPSLKAVTDAQQRVRDSAEAAFDVTDEVGNVMYRLAENGSIASPMLNVASELSVDATGVLDTGFVSIKNCDAYHYVVADNFGNVAFGVDLSGNIIGGFDLIPGAVVYKTSGTYDYEVNHVFTYGQSLSVGQAVPAISTTQAYDNIMFVRGMRPQYDYDSESASQWYASLTGAVEATSPNPTWAAVLGETPAMGTGDAVKQLILSEDGLAFGSMKYQMLLSAPGYGATTIAQLSKGGAYFSRLLEQATYGLALSNAAGKTYAVQAVTWTQGESDYLSATTQATYVTRINTLVSDINTDVKAITGQAKNIPLISYQVASHKQNGVTTPNIALAQLEAESANPLVYISTPMYLFEYQSTSNNHLTNISSRWLGAYHGLAYKRIVIDGVDWKPLKPLSSIKQGAIAVIKFHVPHGNLTLDTTLVALNTNYGFELVDSANSVLTISSVAIMGPDTVKVTAAATIPAGAKLRYAWSGSGNVGNLVGPRGNLRDSQGDSIIFDPMGINKPMHNWCVIFEQGL